jgi:peroxiredoxin
MGSIDPQASPEPIEPPVRTPPPNKASPVLLIFLIFPLIGLIAAVGIFISDVTAAPATPVPVTPPPVTITFEAIPTPAPIVDAQSLEFALTDLDGNTVRLSDYRGRIVFLNFWATWCEPCKRELPTFQQFMREQTGDSSPVVLAVNVEESREQVQAFLDENGVGGFSVLLDTDAAIADTYGVVQIPVTYVIDADGLVRYPKFGEITRQDMDGYVQALGG